MMNEDIIKAAILEADSDYAKYGEDYTHSFSKKTFGAYFF